MRLAFTLVYHSTVVHVGTFCEATKFYVQHFEIDGCCFVVIEQITQQIVLRSTAHFVLAIEIH